MVLPYDDSDSNSILQYAQKLFHNRLRDFVDESIVNEIWNNVWWRWWYWNIIEKYYFLYEPNPRPEPDFPKVWLELKTSPLKKLKSWKKVSKERLVMNKISFMEIIKEERKSCSFLKKNKNLLLMFYLYEKDKSFWDYIIELISLRSFPEKDLLMMEKDWQKIQRKVMDWKAHELSEWDTFYLWACTKARNNLDRTQQPCSDITAKPRAFSLKQTYVNKIIDGLLRQAEESESIFDDLAALKKESFEWYIARKFNDYIGITPQEIANKLWIDLNVKDKEYPAKLARLILWVKWKKIEEFEKADVTMKVIRLNSKGKLKESISFPAFDPKEIVNQEREDSDILQMMDKKFFFVVFQYDDKKNLFLKKVMFWNIPYSDLDIDIRWVFDETKRRINAWNNKNLPKIKENLVSHVRPHGKNKNDVIEYPNGEKDVKKCFRLNAKYIEKQIQ